MGTVKILPETTKKPITLVGQMAGVCYGTDTSDAKKNYARGIDCIESGHHRTLEYVEVAMVLDGYSARVMREWYTHIGGAPTRLQASTRYIDYNNFEYVTPPSIENDENALARYREAMGAISWALRNMPGIPREDAAMLLPLGMTTRVVDKRNLRNLIDMSRNRMCTRAYWEFRELFDDIRVALAQYSEEWAQIVNTQMYPKCKATGYCPEKHGCGLYPPKHPEEKHSTARKVPLEGQTQVEDFE
jgi:thymidylate synthase (FAD)